MDIDVAAGWSRTEALSLAASLNRYSRHPFAGAFRAAVEADPHAKYREIRDLSAQAGSGVSGRTGEHGVAIGSQRFIDGLTGGAARAFPADPGGGRSLCYLACDGKTVARFALGDTLRDDAAGVSDRLRGLGYRLVILSGDSQDAVDSVAGSVGIADCHGGMTPDEKLAFVRRLRDGGSRVAVVGDGINDAPMAALADVSLAMGRAADLTRLHCDAVLLNDRLMEIVEVLDVAARTRRIIGQNLCWALGYNLLAIPCAVIGLVPPWLAALGMSASSLIVCGNAMRLGGPRPAPHAGVAD